MLNAAVYTPAVVDFASFAAPPHRPSRSNRSTDGSRNFVSKAIRAIRQSLSAAADEPSTAWLPRLSAYPY
jgi:ethanolamine utilization microcompartment shell protein EutL